jgi:hypothetical protein
MLKALRQITLPFLRPSLTSFRHSLQAPHDAQQQVLKTIVAGLAATQYGRHLKIKAGDDYQAFAAKTPLVTYDDLSAWVGRQKQTEKPILVAEPVRFYEKTSGSSAPAKFIAYTGSLQASFNRMFAIWLADLLENGPGFESGKTFISISPAFQQAQATERGVKVGLADDADYLNPWLKVLCKPFFVLPASVKQLQEPENFKRAIAALLLAERRLEIISIWNPSFFEVILDFMQDRAEVLIEDLRRGSLTVENLPFKFKRLTNERLQMLRQKTVDWQSLWPELKLISCWTSAQAKQASERLAAKFPGVFLQGKGLLATEAPMTMPLIAAQGFVPMVSDVFFEFLDEQKNLKLLHELETGQEYEIVLTQRGGLYRYRIGDRVRVSKFYRATPCLEFTGRMDAVSDLVGEKLNEQFVQGCLSRLSQQSAFQTLLPVIKDPPHYVLLIDSLRFDSASGALPNPALLETELDNLLCQAFHYRNARMLGQLNAVRVCVAPKARDAYFDYFMSRGQKFGDIKHRFLMANIEDAERFLQKIQSA